MPISKAYTFAIFTNVDHNWSIYLIIGYFSLHQMESIFGHTILSREMNEMMNNIPRPISFITRGPEVLT